MTLWTRDRVAVLVDLEQRRRERAQETEARQQLYPVPRERVENVVPLGLRVEPPDEAA